MKKFLVVITVLFAVISFAGISSVEAYPYIEVEGFVNPWAGMVTDNGNGTTTFSDIEYIFNVTLASDGAKMNYLSLEFENDVFAGVGALISTLPSDWTYTLLTPIGGNSSYEIGSAGTTLGQGEKLIFHISDIVVYNTALSSPVPWQEGGIWGQSWQAGDTLDRGDGGSTALVPEPGTLMMFGSGLVGLFYVRRKGIFKF